MHKKRIAAYVADWSFSAPLKREQTEILTHVNYAFGLIVDGKVSLHEINRREQMMQIRKDFPKVKVNLSVGGWGADGFSQAVATEEGRETLAASAIDCIKELNLTGIDWDWEYPGSDDAGIAWSPDDPEKMTEFLVLMRQKLDLLGEETGEYYEQSIAVGGGRTQDYIWEKALPALDTVNLMTYDMGMGSLVGHVTNLRHCSHASFSAEQSAKAFHDAGVPWEKLMIGAAFYYHAYRGFNEEEPFAKPFEKKEDSIDHDHLTEDFCKHWDEAAAAAYFTRDDLLLSGDDEQSLEAKTDYVLSQQLGGIIIWELNHDKKNLLLPHLKRMREE